MNQDSSHTRENDIDDENETGINEDFQGIDDLLGLSGSNAGEGELNMTEVMLNNTGPALATLGPSSNNTMNNGVTGTQSGDQDLRRSDSNLRTTDDLFFGNLSQPTSSGDLGDGSSLTETWNKMRRNMQQTEQPSSNGKLDSPSKCMPPDLLDGLASLDPYSSSGAPPAQPGVAPAGALGLSPPPPAGQQAVARKPASKPTDEDLSTWLNPFSDLDPLSNPDAIGKENQENDGERSFQSCVIPEL